MWLGYGLALTSMPATSVTSIPNVLAYLRRMGAEEPMLVDSLSDADCDYQAGRKRLVPGLYQPRFSDGPCVPACAPVSAVADGGCFG